MAITDNATHALLIDGEDVATARTRTVVDPATGEPIALDEQGKTVSGDTVTVPIPAGTSVPEHPRVYVVVDGYAFASTASTMRR